MPKSIRKFVCAAGFSLAALATGTVATAQAAQDVHIVLDRGPGGDIFRHAAYGPHAAGLLAEKLRSLGLGDGDQLTLSTFGEGGKFHHLDLPDYNRTIEFGYRKARVADVPAFISGMVSDFAKLPPQGRSDLMVRLPDLSDGVDCSKKVTVFFLTNGYETGTIEDGEFVLDGIPDHARFCGQAEFVGLWVDDPNPSMNLQNSSRRLFKQLAGELGFEDAHIAY